MCCRFLSFSLFNKKKLSLGPVGTLKLLRLGMQLRVKITNLINRCMFKKNFFRSNLKQSKVKNRKTHVQNFQDAERETESQIGC